MENKTMFTVQHQGALLAEGSYYAFPVNEEHEKLEEALSKLQQLNPAIWKQLYQRFWETIALEILKMQTATPPTVKTT